MTSVKKSTGVYLDDRTKARIKKLSPKGKISPWIEEAISEKLGDSARAPSVSEPITDLARHFLPARVQELERALSGSNQGKIITRILDSLADHCERHDAAGIGAEMGPKLESRDCVISITFLEQRQMPPKA